MSLFKKKVIYLVCYPFNVRDYKRFGIKTWLEHKWNVQVFDITSFLHPKLWKYLEAKNSSFNFKGLKVFQNINDVFTALNNLQENVFFIDLLGYSKTEQKIRSVASVHGKFVKLKLAALPIFKTKSNFIKLLILSIKNPIGFFKKLVYFFSDKIYNSRATLNSPDYLVVGGLKSIPNIKNKKISIIKAHNLDYDFCIKANKLKSNSKKNFLVFLDEDGPYHPNTIQLGLKPFLTAKKYYPTIDNGLKQLANSLNLNVKIAAHPRSNYKIRDIKYKYPIIKDKTYELIRDSSLVVAHTSTALQWAIIMKKPIILATTNEIENELDATGYAKIIFNYAELLGKHILNFNNISNINNFNKYLIINDQKYEKYIQNYIKIKGSPKKLAWKIIIERIEKDLFS